MKDLYKRLNLPQDANTEQIRRSVPSVDEKLRASAEMILLEPRRRQVYDRNRQLLLTISELRFDLGLNYTRFWSRRQFRDFWKSPIFVAAAPAAPKRRVDKMMIARAFHTAKHHSRHHAARWGWLWAILATGVVAGIVLVLLWQLSF